MAQSPFQNAILKLRVEKIQARLTARFFFCHAEAANDLSR
jgi:hypothetical protein